MPSKTPTSQPRVNPYKLLGARRAFASLGCGAIFGAAVGMIGMWLPFSAMGLPFRAMGISLYMGLLYGFFLLPFSLLGSVVTLAFALKLAQAGFSHNDFAAGGWVRLILFTLLGLGVGIAVGFIAGLVIAVIIAPIANNAFVMGFLHACISSGGIVGALVPGYVIVGKAAKRRLAQ